jgi:acyl phosphate:glycerol-3-phosphate acyltransferase
MLIDIVLIVLAYLLGSVSAAILVCRIMRLPDPRLGGSGNPGATNVLRLGGRLPAALTLLGDFGKGAAPVLLVVALERADAVSALAGLAALLGHLFPVFFRFRGGKGVATAFGVLLGWSWLALLIAVVTWLAVAAAFRYSSLAALTALTAAPLALALLGVSVSVVTAMVAITVAVYWRHRVNIRQLLNGTERRIGRR